MSRVFAAGSTESAVYDGTPPVTAAPFTVAAWARRTDTGSFRTVLGIGDKDVTNHQWYLQMFDFGSKSVKWEVQAGGTAANSQAPGNWVQNQWHHVAGVEASSTSRTCYLDGSPDATPDTTSRAPSGADRLAIGKVPESSPGAGEYFTGDIAEVGIWNVALTDAEIASLAKGVTPPNIRPGNLVFYAPIVGKHSPEPDLVGGLSLTLTGTSASAHPRVFRKLPRLAAAIMNAATAYTQTLSGTVTPAGTVAKKVTSTKTGTVTPAATIAQKVSKLLSGTVTPAADVATRVFNGQTLEGSVTPTSSITNKVTKTLAGTVTPIGTIVNAVRKALSGAVAPDGTATNVRAQHQSIDGSVTPTASITNLVRQTLTATVTPAATVVKFVAKAVGGTVTPAGTVAKKVAKTLSGSVTPTATLVFKRAMTLTGTVTPAGAITNIYRKASVIWAVAHDALSIFATARDAEEIRGGAFDTATIDSQAYDQESLTAAAHDAASITGEARDG